jgi:predicted nucleic acid-binding protein
MAAIYVDTSVLGRLLLGEPDTPAILAALEGFDRRVTSRLAQVELRRLALRHGNLADADALLTAVALVPLDEDTLTAAETIPPASVATLDGIHLVAATRLAESSLLEALMTYDTRLADGAREHGIEVLAPR